MLYIYIYIYIFCKKRKFHFLFFKNQLNAPKKFDEQLINFFIKSHLNICNTHQHNQ
jgi:hypothetical protein